MDKYNVTGMTCAACSARVEKAVSKVDGVAEVQVNLLTNSMMVDGVATSEQVIDAVTKAGYGASLASDVKGKITDLSSDTNKGEHNSGYQSVDTLRDTETPKIVKRLIVSIIFLIPLMYLSMGHMMWGWPTPAFLDGNPIAIAITQMLFTIIIMVINQKLFISGFKSAIHAAPNMDTLVALGSFASFGYSVYALYAMTIAVQNADMELAHSYMHELYFESAAMILALITVGKSLESYSKGRTTDALKSLMRLAPKTATVVRDGVEEVIDVTLVRSGDIFVVKPGEAIPVDGVVVDGHSAIDESVLTGESIPVDKKEGDKVSAATINANGYIKCEATHVGADTSFAQIIQMVSDAAATKAPIAKIADKVSGVFVPVVLGIALITFVIWKVVGADVGFSISRAIAVLVISCPCALGLATPVAIMVGNGMGAKNGILFKNAIALENAGKIDTVVMDKTGTLTNGKPVVTDVITTDDVLEQDMLRYAFSLEEKSEHPLARAIVEYGKRTGMKAYPVADFKTVPGNGLMGTVVEGKTIYGGNQSFIGQFATISAACIESAERLSKEGKTPLYFACGDTVLGIIAVADTLKSDATQTVRELKSMGKKVVMLTGDNEMTAKALGEKAGVDQVIAGVLPQEKESWVRKLKEQGKVAMVGDGINDAPALTTADVGIAIGAGTDVAIDAADVVLMKDSIGSVVDAVYLSKKVLKNIKENLFWAFFYNVIGIPLAAGAYIHAFGWTLSPMFGAAAMSLSSFCVVTNALRLNLVKMPTIEFSYDNMHKAEESNGLSSGENMNNEQEELIMTQTLVIEGMMCAHCEAHVKKALENMGLTAEVSHEKGTAVVSGAEHSFDEYKAVIDEAGYELKSVE